MGDITLRNIDDARLQTLHELASATGRSPEEEGRLLLEQALANQEYWARVRRFRESFGDKTFSDSVDIIREMRDERTEQLGGP